MAVAAPGTAHRVTGARPSLRERFSARRGRKREPSMIWLILIILLVLIFGLGTVLEATLWLLLILAAVAVIGTLLVGRAIAR